MATVMLRYEVPQNQMKQSAQISALLALQLESTGPDNELSFLDLTQTARTVIAVPGPPAVLQMDVTYLLGPSFTQRYPTAADQAAAVAALWSGRISVGLSTRVTAAAPVFTP